MGRLVVAPALIPDIPRLYEIYFEAFKQDEMGRLIMDILFPSGVTEEFKKAHAAATLAYWHTSESQFTFKCVDMENGEIVGMGLADWVVVPKEKRENPGAPWLEGAQRERAEKILNPLWEARDELIGDQPHIYVHVIAVDPKHQGRKAGTLLCQYGFEQAERTQSPLYFESSPSTYGLYEKVGFETLERKVIHKGADVGTPEDITVPLMIKMPSGAKGMKFEEWKAKGYPRFGVEESKQANGTPAAEKAGAELSQDELLKLLGQLTEACGGEKNVLALASMATMIGIDNVPKLLEALGISTAPPAPAAQ